MRLQRPTAAPRVAAATIRVHVRPARRPMIPYPVLRVSCAACIAGLGLVSTGLAWSQASGDPLVSRPAQFKLGIERTTLPGNEHMGLVGTSYLIDLGGGVTGGPAAYGAISG